MTTIDQRMRAAINSVIDERIEQIKKWGDQTEHPDPVWLAILTEEVGESARAILERDFGHDTTEHLRQEVIQVAAVAVAWIEALDLKLLRGNHA